MKVFPAVLAVVLLATVARPAQSTGALEIIGTMADEPIDDGAWQKKLIGSAVTRQPRVSVRLEKRIVDFERDMEPGSILVQTRERKLFFVLPDKKAIAYPVGVGREGFTWSGTNRVARKAVWPDWRPPANMIEREERRGNFIPAFMPGGPKNPLGARALYIGATEFRIHGTTQPWSIGQALSSGCIRMLNEHVIDLFEQVQVGAVVVVE